MNLRQAAQLALEALENHTAIKHPQQIHYRDAAIEALRTALAEPEQEPVFDCPRCGHCCPERKPLSDKHPLMVFAKECVLGAYSEKELADAANRAIKYAHSFKGEA